MWRMRMTIIWLWINTYRYSLLGPFWGMNIRLPPILMWTTGLHGFDPFPYGTSIVIYAWWWDKLSQRHIVPSLLVGDGTSITVIKVAWMDPMMWKHRYTFEEIWIQWWKSNLVAGLEHEVYYSIIYGIILPIWLSYFSEGWVGWNHQPVIVHGI